MGGWAPRILKIFENAKSFLIRRGVHHQNLGKGGAVRALAASSFYAGKSNCNLLRKLTTLPA